MFGFSISKILVLAGIIVAIWQGFKWISRMQQIRDAADRKDRKATGTSRMRWGAGRRSDDVMSRDPVDVGTMARCPDCGTFYDPAAVSACAEGRDVDRCPVLRHHG